MTLLKERLFIIPLLFVAIAGVCIFVEFSFMNSQKREPAMKIVEKISQTLTPVPTDANMPGWKRYIYPSGFYSFSYPANWTLREDNYIGSPVVLDHTEQTTQEKFFSEIVFGAGGHGLPSNVTHVDKNVIFGGKKAQETIYSIDNIPQEVRVDFNDFSIYSRSPINSIDITLPRRHQKEYISLFEKILSTLKFSRSTASPTSK